MVAIHIFSILYHMSFRTENDVWYIINYIFELELECPNLIQPSLFVALGQKQHPGGVQQHDQHRHHDASQHRYALDPSLIEAREDHHQRNDHGNHATGGAALFARRRRLSGESSSRVQLVEADGERAEPAALGAAAGVGASGRAARVCADVQRLGHVCGVGVSGPGVSRFTSAL